MERITHTITQGSPEWHSFRSTHFGASEAAVVLGLSKYTSRTDLIKAKATGAEKEIGASLQAVFDRGHATEALARPLAEEIVGEILYPSTCSYGTLSASCDGLTMDGEIAFEHKQYSADLFAAVLRNELPDEHQPQCQQVMLVTGAKKLFFVCSDGTREHFAGTWVLPEIGWQANIEAAWAQFQVDLAMYVPTDAAVVPVAAPVRDLPAIRYTLNGLSLTSNLSEFREAALVLVEDSKRELSTDQDFADTDARNKAFKVAEDKIELMAAQVLAEIEDVDKFTRDLKDVGALIRQARLNGEKKVSSRKDAIRLEIIMRGNKSMQDHIAALNARLGNPYMPHMQVADFPGAVRGKRTIVSLNGAVDDEIARAKIETSATADRIQINLKYLELNSSGYAGLFPDVAQIVLKSEDDFASLVKVRIADHKEAEAKRVEDKRVADEALAVEKVRREQEFAELAAARAQAQPVAPPSTPMPVPVQIAPGLAVTLGQPDYADSEAVRAAILKELDGLTKSELLFALDGVRNIKNNRQKFAARA